LSLSDSRPSSTDARERKRGTEERERDGKERDGRERDGKEREAEERDGREIRKRESVGHAHHARTACKLSTPPPPPAHHGPRPRHPRSAAFRPRQRPMQHHSSGTAPNPDSNFNFNSRRESRLVNVVLVTPSSCSMPPKRSASFPTAPQPRYDSGRPELEAVRPRRPAVVPAGVKPLGPAAPEGGRLPPKLGELWRRIPDPDGADGADGADGG
jgi:hypothetical protein